MKLLSRFTVRDLVLTAALAAVGVAIKPLVVPLTHVISAPLMIPGGSLAGGLYMMWMIVAVGLTGKRGTATLFGLVQALLVMGTGVAGSHGALSLLSYTLPGIAVDLGLALMRHRACCAPCSFVAGILANVTGTLLTNWIFFRLPLLPLVLSILVAAFSGAIGGWIAWSLLKQLFHYGIAPQPPSMRGVAP